MSPQRIQRRRAKGWRMPEGAVYVGRPTKWGNPFGVKRLSTREYVVVDHRGVEYVEGWGGKEHATRVAARLYDLHSGPVGIYELDVAEVRRELRGRDLACWCPLDMPCHAETLLRIANEETP
ncbi:DUF4326 domain-containing protein [Arsenicicoccus dermatophilus]